MKSKLVLAILVGVFFIAQVQAEVTTTETPNTTTTTETAATTSADAADAKILGEFEVRPSYGSLAGELHSENTAILGYQLKKDTAVDYVQYFNANLYNPAASTAGLSLRADDGFLRYKLGNFYKNENTSMSFQTRFYLPTNASSRDAGMITYLRNQLKIAQQLTKSLSVDLSVNPIVRIFDRSGNTVGGVASANAAFTQMFVLNADYNITENLLFSFPVIFDMTKYRNYSSTANLNGAWGYNFYVWPEVDYQITPNTMVGAAWYSDNFMNADASGMQISNGLEKGVFQAVLNVKL